MTDDKMIKQETIPHDHLRHLMLKIDYYVSACQDHPAFFKVYHNYRPSLIYSWKSQRWDKYAAFYYYYYYKPRGKKHTLPFTRGKHMTSK